MESDLLILASFRKKSKIAVTLNNIKNNNYEKIFLGLAITAGI